MQPLQRLFERRGFLHFGVRLSLALAQRIQQRGQLGLLFINDGLVGVGRDLVQFYLLVVRLEGALTVAERQLAKSLSPERGRDGP